MARNHIGDRDIVEALQVRAALYTLKLYDPEEARIEDDVEYRETLIERVVGWIDALTVSELEAVHDVTRALVFVPLDARCAGVIKATAAGG
jgi:hypothetical protein